MHNVLVRKLESLSELDEADRALLAATLAPPRTFQRGEDIISDGDEPDAVHLVISGLACRYKLLPDGSRQIFAYLIPGDFCDLHVFVLREMDHSIGAVARSEVIDIPRHAILKLLERPKLAIALWKAVLVDEATLREWIVNVGRRSSTEGIAHFFCEMFLRMKAVGLTSNGSVSVPITQGELADTVGLSAVQANRSLQELRGSGLIEFASGHLVIPDFDSLSDFSGFTPNYLHLADAPA